MFLGNLPPDCKVSDIQQFLEKYGRVRNVLIKQGKYGFAEFDDSRDADDAVYELDGKRLMGSRITLEFAKVSKLQCNAVETHDSRFSSSGPEERRQQSPLGVKVRGSHQDPTLPEGSQPE